LSRGYARGGLSRFPASAWRVSHGRGKFEALATVAVSAAAALDSSRNARNDAFADRLK
jgi:hypothetical protein